MQIANKHEMILNPHSQSKQYKTDEILIFHLVVTHLFNIYLLSTYYVPGPELGKDNTRVYKHPCHHGALLCKRQIIST